MHKPRAVLFFRGSLRESLLLYTQVDLAVHPSISLSLWNWPKVSLFPLLVADISNPDIKWSVLQEGFIVQDTHLLNNRDSEARIQVFTLVFHLRVLNPLPGQWERTFFKLVVLLLLLYTSKPIIVSWLQKNKNTLLHIKWILSMVWLLF